MSDENKRFWIEKELRRLGIIKEGHYISASGETMIDCPDPKHDSKRCAFNVRKGCYYCWSHSENASVKENDCGQGNAIKYFTLIIKKGYSEEQRKETESELLGLYPQQFKSYLEKQGKAKYVKPKEHFNTVNYQEVIRIKELLRDDDECRQLRAILITKQGLTKSVMEIAGLGVELDGWGYLRITIPIIKYHNNIVEVQTLKKYLYNPPEDIPKYIFHKEEGQHFKTTGIYPHKCGEFQLQFKKIAIVEGEFKALCLIPFLNPLGIGVISSINGARGKKWYRDEEFLGLFKKNQEVYIIYDVDDTGIGVVEDIAFTINHRAKFVKICDLFKLLEEVSPGKYLRGKADPTNPEHENKVTGGDPPNWIIDEAEKAELPLKGDDWPQEFIDYIGKKFLEFIKNEEFYDPSEGTDGPVLSHDSPHESKNIFARHKFTALTRKGEEFIAYVNWEGGDYFLNKKTSQWEFATGEKMESWVQRYTEDAKQRCLSKKKPDAFNLDDGSTKIPFNPKTKDIKEIYSALRRSYNFELPDGETLPYPVVGKPIKDFGRNSIMLDNGILDISKLDEIDLVKHESGFLILDPLALCKLNIVDNYPELLNFTRLSVALNPKKPPPFPTVFFKAYQEWLNFDEIALREAQKWAAHIVHPDPDIIDAMLLCKGRGGAGKTRFINMLIALLRKKNCFNTSPAKFGSQFGVARLPGKCAIFMDNAKWKACLNPDLFMERAEKIASRTGVPIERKRFDDFDYTTDALIVMGAESTMPWADPGSQTGRRLYILPFPNFWDFDNKAAYGIPDQGLEGKILKVLDAITLYFILPGIKMLRQDGKFLRIESAEADYEDMENQTSKYKAFIEESLDIIKRSEIPTDLEESIKTSATPVKHVHSLYQNHILKLPDFEEHKRKDKAYGDLKVFSREFTAETGIKKVRYPKHTGERYFIGLVGKEKSSVEVEM